MSTSHLFPSLAYQIAKCPMPRRDLYDRSPEREPWGSEFVGPASALLLPLRHRSDGL